MNVAIKYVITMRIITVIPNFVLCIYLVSYVYGNAYVLSLPQADWIINKHIMRCFLSDCELITTRIWWIQSDETDARLTTRDSMCVKSSCCFRIRKIYIYEIWRDWCFWVMSCYATLNTKIIWFQSHAQRRPTRSSVVHTSRDEGIA